MTTPLVSNRLPTRESRPLQASHGHQSSEGGRALVELGVLVATTELVHPRPLRAWNGREKQSLDPLVLLGRSDLGRWMSIEATVWKHIGKPSQPARKRSTAKRPLDDALGNGACGKSGGEELNNTRAHSLTSTLRRVTLQNWLTNLVQNRDGGAQPWRS